MAKKTKWKYDSKRFNTIRSVVMTRLQNETIRAAGKAKTKEKRAAPKATGALSQSPYVISPKGSGYDEALRLTRELNPHQTPAQELPPIDLPSTGKYERITGLDCPLDYGILIEEGEFDPETETYKGARPWFYPSVDAAFPTFIQDLKKALETL